MLLAIHEFQEGEDTLARRRAGRDCEDDACGQCPCGEGFAVGAPTPLCLARASKKCRFSSRETRGCRGSPTNSFVCVGIGPCRDLHTRTFRAKLCLPSLASPLCSRYKLFKFKKKYNCRNSYTRPTDRPTVALDARDESSGGLSRRRTRRCLTTGQHRRRRTMTPSTA